MNAHQILSLFVQTFFGWSKRKATTYAAAIAYATLFSLAPLLIISINLAALTFNEAVFETRLLETIEDQVGPEAAALTGDILASRMDVTPDRGVTLISIGFLLFGASRVFRQLRVALNAMWHIDVRPASIRHTLLSFSRNLLFSIVLSFALGLAPIVLLFASTVVASVPTQTVLALYQFDWLTQVIAVLASPMVFFVLFAFVLRYLPQATAPWRAIAPGALLSALAYWIGSEILSFYIQNAAIRSIYGAAGSVLALLIWAYYSAYIFLYGARFVYSVAESYGLTIVPDDDAVVVHFAIDDEYQS
jgi:membrane protein